jgi:hypothetical protein
MIRSALFAAGLAVFALSTFSARAWDPLGHMLVGQIAYDNLTPAAKAGVDAAVARFDAKDKPDAPYSFVTSACWMDDIRSRPEPEFKQYAVWHYVNLPFTADGMPIPDPSAGPNVISGIEKTQNILNGKETDPAIDKDQALVMLLHFTGDVHQPLHTTSRGDDAGGNKVKLANLKDPLADLIFSKGGNLHFFWDSSYRRIYKNGDATVSFEAPLYDRATPVAGHNQAEALVRAQATELEKKYPPSIVKDQGDAVSWAKESHAIGFTLGYGKLPVVSGNTPVRLGQKYVDDARNVAEQRIVLAGYRMANFLNAYYAAAPAAETPTPAPSASPSPTAAP